MVLCGWLPVTLKAHSTGPHCSSQVSPCASPSGPSFKRISTEHLLCTRTLGGQAMKAAQGNHGISHLESPSCKSPSGWPGADRQGPGPLLVHSLLQWPLFQIRLMTPDSCASSSHHGFIPVSGKEESSLLTILLTLHWPELRPEHLLWAAMGPTKILYLCEKGEPILGDSRQALPQTLVGSLPFPQG